MKSLSYRWEEVYVGKDLYIDAVWMHSKAYVVSCEVWRIKRVKIFEFFRLKMVYTDVFLERNACNSRMLIPQTRQICSVFLLWGKASKQINLHIVLYYMP